MCGIAGYSLSSGSRVDRTLAAQALLAGIAERGADAVGYAHRGRRGPVTVHKQRSGASALLDLLRVEDGRIAGRDRFQPDRSYREENVLPAVRAPHEGAFCLQRLAVIAAAAA